jgi:hypothetical protein
MQGERERGRENTRRGGEIDQRGKGKSRAKHGDGRGS